jgi:hypothetical protein
VPCVSAPLRHGSLSLELAGAAPRRALASRLCGAAKEWAAPCRAPRRGHQVLGSASLAACPSSCRCVPASWRRCAAACRRRGCRCGAPKRQRSREGRAAAAGGGLSGTGQHLLLGDVRDAHPAALRRPRQIRFCRMTLAAPARCRAVPRAASREDPMRALWRVQTDSTPECRVTRARAAAAWARASSGASFVLHLLHHLSPHPSPGSVHCASVQRLALAPAATLCYALCAS